MDLNFEITALHTHIYILYVFNQINSCVFLNFMSQKSRNKNKNGTIKKSKKYIDTIFLYCFTEISFSFI